MTEEERQELEELRRLRDRLEDYIDTLGMDRVNWSKADRLIEIMYGE